MKKTNKGAKRRLLLLITVFVVLVTYMSYITITYWEKIFENKKIKANLEKEYEELLSEEEILETDVIKLQDPEYVAKYAREKYLYTKDGELIIKIIDNED